MIEEKFVCYDTIGRFGAHDGEVAKDIIADIKSSHVDRFVIDLTRLELIDSSGIGMLLIMNAEAAAKDKSFAMIVGGGQVRKVIDMTQIGLIIPQHDSLLAYLEALR
ncbi:MAG TPA: STAS domain-containing protein [Azospirillaceae bacterium]|nr:STAS domain-containing protein [Azospirillaceae bacterium]